MDMSILLGCMWGVLTAGVHFLLMRKTLGKVVSRTISPSAWIWRVSSATRMLVVGVFLVAGVVWKNLRLDVVVLVYAIIHLGLMISYGVHLSGQHPKNGVESVD